MNSLQNVKKVKITLNYTIQIYPALIYWSSFFYTASYNWFYRIVFRKPLFYLTHLSMPKDEVI